MRIFRQKPAHTRDGEKSGFWLALVFALALHGIILLVPMTIQAPDKKSIPAQIELQLTTIYKDAPLPEPEPIPAVPEKLAASPQESEPPRLVPAPPVRELQHDLKKMTPAQKTRLTNAILSRQFISLESETDKIFGKPIATQATEPQKEFHYPVRQNMVTMLDQPLPDLPFAYTPDLIYFAYEPGVRGDLQRFWDVITPEFGWRTNNGTEFKCKWILIITACGWK